MIGYLRKIEDGSINKQHQCLSRLLEGRTVRLWFSVESEEIREDLHIDFQRRHGSYLRALEQLAEGIDLDAAAVWSLQEREALQSQVEQLHSLAQLGITVEIVGHELEEIDSEINRNLKKFPEKVRSSAPYRDVVSAHKRRGQAPIPVPHETLGVPGQGSP